jgi:hypothetical protein
MQNPRLLKGLIPIVLTFLAVFPSHAANYYWVNGSGLWSNFSNHWAKIPNPTLPAHYHANVPTADDDVFFTDNGGVPYTLTVDAGSTVPKCRNMDWTGVPAGAVWGGSGSRIDIYGSVVLQAGMVISYSGYVQMITLGPTHTIRSNGVHFPVEVIFSSTGGGGWQLLDDFYCDGRVNHEGGLIETNGHTVTIGDTFFGNYYAPNGELRLGSSEFIVLNGNAFFKYSSAQFDAGSSHIKMYGDSVSLEGTAHFSSPTHYNDVSFFGRCSPQKGFVWGNVNGTLTFHQFGLIGNYNTSAFVPVLNNVVFLEDGLISNVNSYNSLTFSPGGTYTVQDVAVINGSPPSNTDQIILPGGTLNVMGNGTCNGFITMRSWQAGTAFEMVNNSGADQTVHCVILEDVHAAGANALRANDYVDLGNCLNWVFLTPSAGFDLYWVGGPGDWDDPCHWTSNASAVTGDCACIPNGATNVFFTANSGFTPATNDVEQVRTPVDGSYIAFMNMDWSGVTGNPTFISVFNGLNTSDQYIYGSVAYSPDMTLDFRGASRFRGKGVHTITSAGKAFRSNVFFEGTGEYQFLDNIIFDNFAYTPGFTVYHLRGTIRTLGNSIYLGPNKSWFGNKNVSNNFVDQGAVLWLGEVGGNSSTVTFSGNGAFRAGYQPGNFHPVESHIIAYQNNGSPYVTAENRPHDFWDVSFYNSFSSGAGYFYGGILNKLTYHENTYAIIENSTPNRLIHELEMKSSGEIRGNQTFDIMTLTGGNVYRFQDGTVQTITSGGALNTSSDCEKYVTLNTGFPDKTATLKKEGGGAIVVNNIILENVIGDVSTGATYSATNGILQGNTTGWTASLPPARTLYWVGGGGNWNDASHWSLSSGGPGGECPPTPLDNVFFNAGSGVGPGNNVTLTQNWAYCKDMDWTGAGAGTILSGIGRSLHIFGSLTLSSAMTYSVSGTYFRADQPATITSAGRKYFFVYFWSPNGEWTLLDAFETVPDVDIHHYYGILHTNNQHVGVGRIWWGAVQSPWIIQGYTPSPTAQLFLGSSKIRFNPTPIWAANGLFNYVPGNFDAGTSEFIFESGVYSTLVAYTDLSFYDATFKAVNGNLTNSRILGKVVFEKNGAISGANYEIHEAEFWDDATIGGSRSYHSIKFAPGKRYTFQAGSVQTIVPHNGVEGQFIAQGLPGQFIELKSGNLNSPATIHMDDYNGTSTCTKYLFLSGMTHTGTEDIYVPTPGGDVFNNSGWLFFPCNPCPATIPVLDPASITTGCPPGKAKLILAGLQPDEWANWYTDPAATTNLVYSGGLGGNLFEPDITGPTTYYARVYSDGGLCESTVVLAVDITLVTPPTAFNVTGGGTVCVGGSGVPVGLDGSETGVSYQLQLDGLNLGAPLPGTGAALSFGLQTAPGTYTVIATLDGTACPADMNSSALITGDPNQAPVVAASSNGPLCEGSGDLQLSETGGDAVSWSWTGPGGFVSADQNPVIVNPAPGNSGMYTVVITDANGCNNTGIVNVDIFPLPMANTPANQELCAGENTAAVLFTGSPPGAVFQWTNDNPAIGLPAAGTGDIASFIAQNNTAGPITATIIVTPKTGDTVKPTPVCTNSLVVQILSSGTAEVLASYLDAGSYDNCGPVVLSFSPDVNDVTAIFDCDDLGQNTVEVWVTDINGNQDYCETYLQVHDPNNYCSASPKPAGAKAGKGGGQSAQKNPPGCTTCTGAPVSFTITVHPQPTVTVPANQAYCSGTPTAPLSFSGAIPGTVFNWSNDNPPIGLPASGTGDIPSFIPQNAGVATITVTPEYDDNGVGCTGQPQSFTITVEAGTLSISCPANVPPLQVNANCQAVLGDYTGLAVVSGSCSVPLNAVVQTPAPGTVVSASTQVTLSVVNASGQSASCTFTVKKQGCGNFPWDGD